MAIEFGFFAMDEVMAQANAAMTDSFQEREKKLRRVRYQQLVKKSDIACALGEAENILSASHLNNVRVDFFLGSETFRTVQDVYLHEAKKSRAKLGIEFEDTLPGVVESQVKSAQFTEDGTYAISLTGREIDVVTRALQAYSQEHIATALVDLNERFISEGGMRSEVYTNWITKRKKGI